MMELGVGRSSRLIELPAGGELTGYIGRLHPSAGTHDPLFVRCIAFDDGRTRVALAQCDLLGLSPGVVSRVRNRVVRLAPTAAAEVVVACSHTHSGPPSISLENCGVIDARWMEGLIETIAAAVYDALAAVKPSYLSFSTGYCRTAFNRVAGRSEEEDRLLDDEVMTMEIAATPRGIPHTMLVNYACHPVALNEGSLLYSRDFPHFAEVRLREALGADLELIFAAGACGDLDPIRRGGFAEAEWNGARLAESVLASRARAHGLRPPGASRAGLSFRRRIVRIPLDRAYSDERLALMAEENGRLHSPGDHAAEGSAEGEIGRKIATARLGYARRMLAASAAGALPAWVDAEIAVIRIGELVLVTMPFELFNEIGQMIKGHFGVGNTMVVCYANGDFGYVMSERLYDRSTYERKEAFLYYGYPGPMTRAAPALLAEAILNEGSSPRAPR